MKNIPKLVVLLAYHFIGIECDSQGEVSVSYCSLVNPSTFPF